MLLHSHKKQIGFSLIELVTVLLIITVLSTIAIRSTVDIGYSARYEQTRDRLESIKKAIVGNPKRSINGQPDISGFVADMGRLPVNLHELLEEDFCLTDRTITNQVTCEALSAGTDWNNQQIAAIDSGNTNLKYGWRGPYLNVSEDPASGDAYTDGWGREAQGYCNLPTSNPETVMNAASCPDISESNWSGENSDHNYGWYFQKNTDDLIFLSYGKDHISGGIDYDEDYPVLKPVLKEDWLIDISSGIQVTFTAPVTINTGDRNACIQAGGTWKNACVIDEAKCTTATVTNPDLLGQWVSDTTNSFDFCKMREGDTATFCKAQRGSDNRSGSWKTCHFLSRQSCLLARGEWREKYSENTDTTCNEVTAANNCDNFTRQECEGGAGVFENGQCYTCDITDQNLCTDSGGTSDDAPDPTTYPTTQINCKTNGGNWDTGTSLCMGANFCEFNDSQQCRDIGGNWSESCQFDYDSCVDATTGGIAATWNAAQSRCSTELPAQLLFEASEAYYVLQDIVMEISYRSNAGLEVAVSTNAVVQENGKSQTILFNTFVDSNDDTIAITEIPIGINSILITKNGGDIYPASCSGLTQSQCEAADGGDAVNPATLLDNGMCDNLTITECIRDNDGDTFPDGQLIRNVLKVPFIPRKNNPILNW